MEAFRLLEKQECTIRDSFWSRYISLVKNTVIPYQWEILNDRIADSEPSHAIDNFRIAAGDMEGRFYGQVFQDSDVSGWRQWAMYSCWSGIKSWRKRRIQSSIS